MYGRVTQAAFRRPRAINKGAGCGSASGALAKGVSSVMKGVVTLQQSRHCAASSSTAAVAALPALRILCLFAVVLFPSAAQRNTLHTVSPNDDVVAVWRCLLMAYSSSCRFALLRLRAALFLFASVFNYREDVALLLCALHCNQQDSPDDNNSGLRVSLYLWKRTSSSLKAVKT